MPSAHALSCVRGPRESGDGILETFTTEHESHKVAVRHTPYRDVMRIARITVCCIVSSLIPLTIAATPAIAGPTNGMQRDGG
jgi:hypothetical protein